jgi:hypothetical protein
MTAATEKQIRMTAQLYEMRDLAKMLLQDRYAARMVELGEVINNVATAQKISLLAAATLLAKAPTNTPMGAILVMAAVVELMEPSS